MHYCFSLFFLSHSGQSSDPFIHNSLAFEPSVQPRAPSPDTFNEFPINVKQAYKAFAAVPHSMAVLEPPQVGLKLQAVLSMPWLF